MTIPILFLLKDILNIQIQSLLKRNSLEFVLKKRIKQVKNDMTPFRTCFATLVTFLA